MAFITFYRNLGKKNARVNDPGLSYNIKSVEQKKGDNKTSDKKFK